MQTIYEWGVWLNATIINSNLWVLIGVHYNSRLLHLITHPRATKTKPTAPVELAGAADPLEVASRGRLNVTDLDFGGMTSFPQSKNGEEQGKNKYSTTMELSVSSAEWQKLWSGTCSQTTKK